MLKGESGWVRAFSYDKIQRDDKFSPPEYEPGSSVPYSYLLTERTLPSTYADKEENNTKCSMVNRL